MIQELLQERELLPILTMQNGTPVTLENWKERRSEMLSLLETYSYGKTPELPVTVSGEVLSREEVLDGTSIKETIAITLTLSKEDTPSKTFTFPITLTKTKNAVRPVPILSISVVKPGLIGDAYGDPTKMILEHGFAHVFLNFVDLVNDNHDGDYSDGLAVFFDVKNPRKPDEWGKIGLWAYGCSRVLDYLLTRGDLDAAHTILKGHSRLGKTVLWAGAQDERFYGIIDNASGYGGAATSKRASGERVTDFLRAGSWDWFCENFKDYQGEKEDKKPYDQAFLLALLAPRFYALGSADADPDSDPVSMYLTALHASSAWELFGKKGLIIPDRLPKSGDHFTEGTIGFHMRSGKHACTLEDWKYYLDFYTQKLSEENIR